MRDLSSDQGSAKVAPAKAHGTGGLVQIGGLGHRAAAPAAPAAADAAPPPDLPPVGDLPEMVLIPAGPFRMGNPGRRNESPVQEIDLPAFELGRFPVTNGQYRRYCEETGTAFPEDPPGWGAYGRDFPDHPVIHVNFKSAVAYCAWLSRVTGETYRLPKESEWEKAARGGLEQKTYPWGDEDPDGHAHFGGRAYAWEITMEGPQTRRVGCFPPNGYDLYDMAGNVWEWCDDFYAPYGAPKRHGGIFRIARGGCWASDADSLRNAFRMSFYLTTFDFFIGFRCARSL
jgi:formylglycine-generating enzyme required for sulfatase activity